MRPSHASDPLGLPLRRFAASAVVTAPDGHLVAVNPAAEAMYGCSEGAVLGQPVEELAVPTDARVRASLASSLRAGTAWEGECRMRLAAGGETTLHLIQAPLARAEPGSPRLRLAVTVPEPRMASRALLQAMVANSPVSLTVIDAANRIVRTIPDATTPRAEGETAVGKVVDEVLPDPQMRTLLAKVRRGGRLRRTFHVGVRAYDTTAVALPDEVAGPRGVALIATDITDRLAEADRFQAVVENLDDVICILDRTGEAVYVSPSIEKVAGYSPEEVLRINFEGLVHPDDLAGYRAVIAGVVSRRGEVVRHTFRARRHDGTWRHVEQTVVNHLHQAAVQGLLGVSRDITERRVAEERSRSMTRLHTLLRDAGAVMMQASDPTTLLESLCRLLVDGGGFAAAAVTTTPDQGREVLVLAEAHGTADGGPDRTTAAMVEATRSAAPPAGTTVLPVPRREGGSAALVLSLPRGELVDPEHLNLLEGMVRDLALTLDSLTVQHALAEAMELMARRARQQAVLSALGLLALGMAEPLEVMRAALGAMEDFGFLRTAVCESAGAEMVRLVAVAGQAHPPAGTLVPRPLAPLVAQVLDSGEPVTVDDLAANHCPDLPEPGGCAVTGSLVAVPILVCGTATAVLAAKSSAVRGFDEQDVQFFEAIAHVISGAVERSRYEADLRREGLHDRLTGLPNATLFQDRLGQALTRCDGRTKLAVLVAEVDGLRLINDSLGHEGGDRLLALVAARLGELVRPGDTVARLRDCQFAILLEGMTDPCEATGLAARIVQQAAAGGLVVGEREVRATLSVGVSIGDGRGSSDDLLRGAEGALHRAKQGGRGRWEIADEVLRRRLANRLQIQEGLSGALERDEFGLVFQPIVDLATGAVSEAEALLRWTRPDGTPVSPVDFVPVAEETGDIVRLGGWVLRRACAEAQRWNAHLPGDQSVGVAVNLSARQIADVHLIATVREALEVSRLDPSLLRLEITETALMEEGDGAAQTVAELDRMGIRLSIDDFGTGYSSLMYLREYPVRALKIDRYFVAGLGKNPEDEAIVHAVVALAHSLGLTATAEGVETTEQLRHLRRLGCDAGQGYLWSRPVSVEHFVTRLAEIRRLPGDPNDAADVLPAVEMARLATPSRCRVVLADDSASDRGLLRLGLEASGAFTVAGEAEDGEQALALAREFLPDLLVLDMSMPRLNGLEVLHAVRLLAPSTRVVFLSGCMSPALARTVERGGALAHLDKSLPISTVVATMMALVKEQVPAPRHRAAG